MESTIMEEEKLDKIYVPYEFNLFTIIDGLVQAFHFDIKDEETLKSVFDFRDEFYVPDELYITGYVKNFKCRHLMVMFADGEFEDWKNTFKYKED